MNNNKSLGFTVVLVLLTAVSQQVASRGGGGFGGFGGGGDRGGDFHGGDFGGDAWHARGGDGVGGTWHNDGYHADPYYGGGYHGAYTVNHYYANGCYNCAGVGWNAGEEAAVAGTAAAYAVGTMVVRPPTSGCSQHDRFGINYLRCDQTWFRIYYGNNGPYYKVVDPPP
jgi:hypothetical protein